MSATGVLRHCQVRPIAGDRAISTQPAQPYIRRRLQRKSEESDPQHKKKFQYCSFEQYYEFMPSWPTERQEQIAAFLHSESGKRGVMPTQREIAKRFGFASLNSVRSHLRLMEKKGILSRLPGKARGLKLKYRPPKGIPLLGHIAAGHPEMAVQDADEVVPISPELFPGSDLFALRVRGESMKNAGILQIIIESGYLSLLNTHEIVTYYELEASFDYLKQKVSFSFS